jgi:CheY-like chemotaxis protein
LSNGPQPPPFDVVLMDLQMPEMDGYQATAKLRADARFTALPIIAMTAHATIEERQRCLAAGMNDHVSKPIDPGMLFETVGKFYKPPVGTSRCDVPARGAAGGIVAPLDAARTAQRAVPTTDGLPSITGLDTKDGLSRVAGNRKLYLKLLRQFVDQQGPTIRDVATALAKGDSSVAERLAHTLKGVAGNIGAKTIQAAAGDLEELIRDRVGAAHLEPAQQKVSAALDPLVEQLRAALGPVDAKTPAQPAASAPADPAQTREAAAQLSKLLSEFDPGAADFLESNHAVLRPLFAGETWTPFEKLVQGYSFAEAQARLEQALKNLSPA